MPCSAANASARSPLGIAGRDELRLGQVAQRRGVDLPDLAAADQGGPQSVHRHGPGKYFAPIARRKASDRAISSMPFIPSSMLTQPS